jgi:lipopolysaccharide assembly outer membrane protein LptD (OstA)
MISDQAVLSLSGASLNGAEASGAVTISLNNSLKIETEAISYNKEKNSVFAPGHVRVTSETLDTEGDELSVDLESEHFTFSRSVASTIRPEKSPLPAQENKKS